MNTHTHKMTCMRYFVEVLFIIAPHWKQPKCPLKGEWVTKSWYNHTMKYYTISNLKVTTDTHSKVGKYHTYWSLETLKHKEAWHKRIYPARFHVCGILKRAKQIYGVRYVIAYEGWGLTGKVL